MSDYKYRDKLLRKMGFQNYWYYLSSDLWKKEIRPKVIEEFDSKCMICKRKASKPEIHHLEYNESNLSGTSINGMIVLCRSCHKKAEFKKGKKRSMSQVNDYITNMIIKNKRRR